LGNWAIARQSLEYPGKSRTLFERHGTTRGAFGLGGSIEVRLKEVCLKEVCLKKVCLKEVCLKKVLEDV
jgi:hypothetical protein